MPKTRGVIKISSQKSQHAAEKKNVRSGQRLLNLSHGGLIIEWDEKD